MTYALVVFAATTAFAYPVGVADIEIGDAMGLTKVDDLTRAFVSCIPDGTLRTQGLAVACPVEFLPAPRAFCTARHLLGKAAEDLAHPTLF